MNFNELILPKGISTISTTGGKRRRQSRSRRTKNRRHKKSNKFHSRRHR